MFKYTSTHEKLKELFSPTMPKIGMPDTKINIYNANFSSNLKANHFLPEDDREVSENNKFSYPIFAPTDETSMKTILLFHGLNERCWHKYLTWAYYLAKETNSWVVLFPLSFHINRTPPSWVNPRDAFRSYNNRIASLGNIYKSSFSNVTLSNRLCENPLRFFSSGYQTIDDVVALVSSITSGAHPIIPKSQDINIFAYSIGAFMAQIVLMSNPLKLFTNSKLFMFCGGSVFSNMQGTSKLIMDKLAYDNVLEYYVKRFEPLTAKENSFGEFLKTNPVALAFRSMIDFDRLKLLREGIFKKLRDNISAISLQRDTVIPYKGVVRTLCSDNTTVHQNVEIWDFPYQYTHENPFPILQGEASRDVDYNFNRVFSAASLFLR